MSGRASAAALAAGTGGGSRPTRPVASLALFATAASVLAAGLGLVGAGVAWAPSPGAVRAVSRGAQLYAAECARCHGARLEGWDPRTRPDARTSRSAPSLGQAGHAWRHSDAELAAIMARGRKEAGMPAFAERLGRDGIDAVLAYVKSGWPGSARAYQAALGSGGDVALAAWLRDPDWVFAGQCLPVPDAADGR